MSGHGLDEFALISHLVDRLPAAARIGFAVRRGIGDDAAVLRGQPGEDWLVSTDTLVEGVHFPHGAAGPRSDAADFAAVGFKSIAVSVSDIAAMGGIARGVVLSVAIPATVALADLEALYDGVGAACAAFACPLVGGDMVSTAGPLVLTTTVQGSLPAATAILRSGARPGDVLFVTGDLGGSGAGLAWLLRADAQAPALSAADVLRLQQAYWRPQPQTIAGPILRESGATALNDVSDGLASELNEIAIASGVRLRVEADRVPVSPAVRNFARGRGEDALSYAWYGGEDYQLVGTAPSFNYARALARCESVGVRLTQIGRVEAGEAAVVATYADGHAEVLEPRGFHHFR